MASYMTAKPLIVSNEVAAIEYGGVGGYATAMINENKNGGDIVAGSSLRVYSSSGSYQPFLSQAANGSTAAGGLVGTWRLMSRKISPATGYRVGGLWMRIA